jgi:hypothetical protein
MKKAICRSSRRISLQTAMLGTLSTMLFASGFATAQTATTRKHLNQVDFSVSAIGTLSPSTSGTNYLPQAVAQRPSNTVGVFFDLGFQRSKWFGLQLNFSQARFSENFTVTNLPTTPKANSPFAIDVQSKVNEYSLGYMVRPGTYFGVETFAGGGVGLVEFRPTAGGGQGQEVEDRTGIFYAVGAQKLLFGTNHFGARVQLRQIFYGQPDYNANYFATGARGYTLEPGFGFFLRF